MDNDTQNNSIHERVLGRIKRGEIKMRPHWHFVLRGALWFTGIILATLTVLFIISFTLFVLRLTGVWFVPIFGWHGLIVFLRSLPWLLVITSIVFIVVLEVLVRHYAFAYRRPLLYSVFGVIVLVVAGVLIIGSLPIHGWFFERARENHLPFAGQLYREFGEQGFDDVHVGNVVDLIQGGFTLRTRRAEVFEVRVTPETRLPFGSDFQPGDWLVVFGDSDDHIVQALGIRRIDPNNRPPRSSDWRSPYSPFFNAPR